MLLRITDILLRNLKDDANSLDHENEISSNKTDHLETLVEKIKECGVSFAIWKNKSSELDWTSLTGIDKRKLLENLPSKLFFNIHQDTHDTVVKLWDDFRKLHEFLCVILYPKQSRPRCCLQ